MMVFVGDNQERELFGLWSGLSARQAQWLTKVAVRSSEQELFSKYVLREIMDRHDVATAHLGDFLDYSCESEWLSVSDALTDAQWGRMFVTPGNHDGLFQGNNHYGPIARLGLRLQAAWDRGRTDASLSRHFSAVCNAGMQRNQTTRTSAFRKRDFFCAYADKLSASGSNIPISIARACAAQKKERRSSHDAEAEAVVLELPELAVGRTSVIGTTAMRHYLGASFNSPFPLRWSPGFVVQALHLEKPTGPEVDDDATAIHLVMLDTTDWAGPPEYGFFCWSMDNADCGVISLAQQASVEKYLTEVRPGAIAILSGHYPLRDLHQRSKAWVLHTAEALQRRGVVTAYLSAHSHLGYVQHHDLPSRSGTLLEVNLDSLTDWPISYWTLSATQGEYCFTPHDAWRELECSHILSEEDRKTIASSADRYREHIALWSFDYGKEQWRRRAADAGRALSWFTRRAGLEVECPDPGPVQLDKQVPEIASCRKRVDDALRMDAHGRRLAACSAIRGAAAFVEPARGVRNAAHYGRQCIKASQAN